MRVVVIGAGVVGLTTCWFLANQGVEVTLIDRNTHVAQETSYANGGQLSYNYVAPLADPSVLPKLARWLLKADSPLKFQPRLNVHQWRWCYSFLKACTHSRVKKTMGEMLDLSLRSRSLMDFLISEYPIDFNLQRTGKIVIYRAAKDLEAARAGVDYQRGLGHEQRLVTSEECVSLEPALRPIGQAIHGGVYTPTEATGDCQQFCEGLYAHLNAMPNFRAQLGRDVKALVRDGFRIASVRTTAGDVEADAFVLAAGLDSNRLASPLGLNLPLLGLRGYSLTAGMSAGFIAPKMSITDADRKIVYAPLGNKLRMAAMVDIGVTTASLDPNRIALFKRQVSQVFPDLDLTTSMPWAGLRPATATSKPIIDKAGELSNLWLNVGHGALGFTLACSSAELVTDLILQREPKVNALAFALSATM